MAELSATYAPQSLVAAMRSSLFLKLMPVIWARYFTAKGIIRVSGNTGTNRSSTKVYNPQVFLCITDDPNFIINCKPQPWNSPRVIGTASCR